MNSSIIFDILMLRTREEHLLKKRLDQRARYARQKASGQLKKKIRNAKTTGKLSEGDPSFEQEVDMVELSSEGEDLGSFHQRKENQSAAVAIAASSAPQVSSRPSQLSNISKTANAMRQLRRKSSGTGEKNLNIVSETSMDGSVDSLKSDDDCDDDEISLIPNEELDYIDLQDPLETAYCSWKGMNEKARRATLRAYFSRIASFLPTRYPRNNKTTILTSAIHYLDEVTRDNLILGIEEEMLMQKHHVLRKHRGRLDKIIKKRRS